MSNKKWLLAATAAAFIITSMGFAAAQQSPLPPAPAEKIAPQSRELNSPASPGVTGGAVTEGSGAARTDTTKEIGEGNRTGELQENRGRSDTTGQAPSRDENRVPNDKKSDEKVRPQSFTPGEGKGGIFEETIPPEDRARYREVFTKARDARVDHVDFDLSVGVKIPSSIPIVPIPAEIDYFVSGDKVVIVDPQSLEIAAIFTV